MSEKKSLFSRIWYGIGRTLIEGLRADSLYAGIFKVSQLLSILLVIAGLILILVFRKIKNKGMDAE